MITCVKVNLINKKNKLVIYNNDYIINKYTKIIYKVNFVSSNDSKEYT